MKYLERIGKDNFQRFAKAEQYVAFLELVPGGHSSGEKEKCGRISKTENCHLRRLLVESALTGVGYKSKALKSRQKGN